MSMSGRCCTHSVLSCSSACVLTALSVDCRAPSNWVSAVCTSAGSTDMVDILFVGKVEWACAREVSVCYEARSGMQTDKCMQDCSVVWWCTRG